MLNVRLNMKLTVWPTMRLNGRLLNGRLLNGRLLNGSLLNGRLLNVWLSGGWMEVRLLLLNGKLKCQAECGAELNNDAKCESEM